jgi:hypothetical protein
MLCQVQVCDCSWGQEGRLRGAHRAGMHRRPHAQESGQLIEGLQSLQVRSGRLQNELHDQQRLRARQGVRHGTGERRLRGRGRHGCSFRRLGVRLHDGGAVTRNGFVVDPGVAVGRREIRHWAGPLAHARGSVQPGSNTRPMNRYCGSTVPPRPSNSSVLNAGPLLPVVLRGSVLSGQESPELLHP